LRKKSQGDAGCRAKRDAPLVRRVFDARVRVPVIV
jgi:hypothetical protein